MAVIRWDAQKWTEWDTPLARMQEGRPYSGEEIDQMNKTGTPTVELPAIEIAAHPETLERL
jgi:hypothetical protein